MKIYDKYQSKIFEGEVVINNLNNKMSKSEIAKIVLTQVKEDLPVDIAIINTGAIRTTFNKGPLLIEDIYEAMPFDNEFYIIRMPGSALKNFITYAGDYLATSQLSNVMNNRIYNVGIIDYVYNKVYYNGFFTSYEKHNSGVYLKEVALKRQLTQGGCEKAYQLTQEDFNFAFSAQSLGYGYTSVANYLGIKPATVKDWFNGRSRKKEKEQFNKLSDEEKNRLIGRVKTAELSGKPKSISSI